MKTSKIFSIVIALAAALLILAGSISLPILVRPFYYVHIDALSIEEASGFDRATIVQAYDEMLNFCVLGTPFGTGSLRWSESGRSHFADVALLFRVDFAVMAAATAALLVCLLLYRKGRVRPHRFLRRGPQFWSGLVTAAVFVVVAALASRNFDAAFVRFHQIFFPGKENWTFDPAVDEIIRILPEQFFMDCAILIVAVLLVCCLLMVLSDILPRHKRA
ncbi:MAG: TIGR01906 family membrane protein [Oscillospiraceae bacterium]|nr:TIGR01906 family membrane protein [Oscillospiraceae bacterium]